MASKSFAEILKQADIEADAAQVEFKLIEPGDYPCTITKSTYNEDSGYPQIVLEMTLDGSRRKQWFRLNFSENENSRNYAVRTMSRLGLTPASLKAAAADPETVFTGLPVIATVEIRTWNEKDRNNVKWISPAPGVDYKSLAAKNLGHASVAASKAPSDPF